MEKTVTIRSLGELLFATMVERRMGVRGTGQAIGMSAATVSRITQGTGFEMKWIIPIAKWCGINATQLWELLESATPATPAPGG